MKKSGNFKRVISIDQLNELTVTQKKNLRTWWLEKIAPLDKCVIENRVSAVMDIFAIEDIKANGQAYPLLDIGQMIDLLIDLKESFGIINSEEEDQAGMFLTIFGAESGDKKEDICDILWRTVVETLPKSEFELE